MNTSERIRGKAQELAGGLKKVVGHATKNNALENEGEAQRLAGIARSDAAKIAERVHGAAEEAKGSVKKAVGEVTGDGSKKVEGAVEQAKGEVEQRIDR